MPVSVPAGNSALSVLGMSRRGPFGPGDFRPSLQAVGATASQQSTILIKDPPSGHVQTFAVGDPLEITALGAGGLQDVYLRVDAAYDPGAGSGYWIYNVTRMSGSPATFSAGTAVIDWGPSGSGAIALSADGQVGATPNISMYAHAGQPWASKTLISRWGNLNGSYGISANTPGIGIGDYSTVNFVKYDTVNGFLLSAGGGAVSMDATGLTLTQGLGAVNKVKFGTGSAIFSSAAVLQLEAGLLGNGSDGQIALVADTNSGTGYVQLSVDTSAGVTLQSGGGMPANFRVAGLTMLGSVISGAPTATLDVRGNAVLTQAIAVSGSPTALTITGGAHTTLAAGAEAIDVNLNLARTVQFATGAITTQRAVVIQAPTYSFVAASTITQAATLHVQGSPVAGTNGTITTNIVGLFTNETFSAVIALDHYSATAIRQPIHFLRRARGTFTSPTIITGGDALGSLQFQGYTGAAFRVAARIDATSEGTPANDTSMAGRLGFFTTPDGSITAVERLRIDNKGSVIMGAGALATNATDGFFYADACAGAPTGVPTTNTGRVPLVFDSTNNFLYAYLNGAWKKTTVFA